MLDYKLVKISEWLVNIRDIKLVKFSEKLVLMTRTFHSECVIKKIVKMTDEVVTSHDPTVVKTLDS